MINRKGKQPPLPGKAALKKENILQHRRKQMIAEHGRFFSQNTCAMLESLSTYELQCLLFSPHLSELFKKGHDLKIDHQLLP